MKRFFAIYIVFFCSLIVYSQQPEQLVEQMMNKLEAAAIQADFVLGLQDDLLDDEPQIYRGTILMQGSRFHLTMQGQGIEVFYDGNTQWAYAKSADELTITIPTADDLAGTNPLFMLRKLQKQCFLEFYTAETLVGCHMIAFYPKKEKSELRKLLVAINKSDLMPRKVILETSQSNITTLLLSNLKTNVKVTNESFSVNPKQYPNAFINDLR